MFLPFIGQRGVKLYLERTINNILSAGRPDATLSASLIGTPKGARPDPATYLSEAYLDAHAHLFKEGAARVQKSPPSSYSASGQVGRTETWVMPKATALKLIAEANGNVAKLEQALGFAPGELGSNPVLIVVPAPKNLRMPNGNEAGANQFWRPGGFTSGGTSEAVIDPVPLGAYVESSVF